ncbi:hypothetical protein ColTof3_03735 [Colletotrichum tofieldiae]|nr:hypothetical protein ColTof3_03735 [Colletotrichum tofieldiae]
MCVLPGPAKAIEPPFVKLPADCVILSPIPDASPDGCSSTLGLGLSIFSHHPNSVSLLPTQRFGSHAAQTQHSPENVSKRAVVTRSDRVTRVPKIKG